MVFLTGNEAMKSCPLVAALLKNGRIEFTHVIVQMRILIFIFVYVLSSWSW